MSREVVGRAGGVMGAAALVAWVLIRRHGRRAVRRAEDVAEADPWAELLSPHAKAETDVTEVQWPTDVSAQLAKLQAGLEALRTEGQRQRRGPRHKWLLAYLVLGGSIVLVIIGIRLGLDAKPHYDAAKNTQTQIASLNKKITSLNNQIDHAYDATKADRVALAKCKGLTGDKAIADCIVKADPTYAKRVSSTITNDMQTLIKDQYAVSLENFGVQANNFVGHQLEVGGPAVLAFASAITGAVLGWMLSEWFADLSRRRVGEPESSEWNQL